MKKECPACRNRLPENLRSDAKFCSASCRDLFNAAMRCMRKPCDQCGLPYYIRDCDAVCLRCSWHEYCFRFRNENRSLIDWLAEKSMCFYCGEIGSEVEHVVPVRTGMPTTTVIACGECNRIAGGNLFENIVEKSNFIKQKREAKYRKILLTPEWGDVEIAELRGRLRSYVMASLAAKKIIKAQVEWNAAEEYMKFMESTP